MHKTNKKRDRNSTAICALEIVHHLCRNDLFWGHTSADEHVILAKTAATTIIDEHKDE